MPPDTPRPRAFHNIGAVARRTGLKPDLIRAWERRYGAVEPHRTTTDRRLYTDTDIERLKLLAAATRRGHAIGQVSALGDDDLRALLAAADNGARAPFPHPEAADLEPYVARLRAAIETLDWRALSDALDQASFDLGRITLVERLLVPLLEWVGAQWSRGLLDPAQEHLATATVRTFLGTFLATDRGRDAPSIVVTTPAGQRHELGALLAAATAAAERWHVVYLGADLPAASIGRAMSLARARVLALSITYLQASPAPTKELERLCETLGGVKVVVGGAGAAALVPLLERLGAHHAPSLSHLRVLLRELGAGAAAGSPD